MDRRISLRQAVEMVIVGNVLQWLPVEGGLRQGPPVSPILLVIHTAGRILSVEDRVQGVEGHSFVDELVWAATGNDLNQVVLTLKARAVERIERASR
jgi:hypothetical protein